MTGLFVTITAFLMSLHLSLGFTPDTAYLEKFGRNFGTMLADGEYTPLLNMFTDDARYCQPHCAIGKAEIVENYFSQSSGLFDYVSVDIADNIVDDSTFYIEWEALIEKGECSGTISGRSIAYFEESGLIADYHTVFIPSQQAFIAQIATVANCQENEDNISDIK